MADDNTPQGPAEPEQQASEPTEMVEQAPTEKDKTVPLADLVKERKERQRIAKELEALRTASLSDTEKAIAEAEKRGESSALSRVGSRLVDAEVRAAAAGRLDKDMIDALLDGLDRSRFLGEDGEVDTEAVAKWIGRLPSSGPRRPSGDIDQGIKPGAPAEPQDPASLADAVLAQRGY